MYFNVVWKQTTCINEDELECLTGHLSVNVVCNGRLDHDSDRVHLFFSWGYTSQTTLADTVDYHHLSHSLHLNCHFRKLNWRYLPYDILWKAYVRESPQQIWPNIWSGTVPPLNRILKISHWSSMSLRDPSNVQRRDFPRDQHWGWAARWIVASWDISGILFFVYGWLR